MNSHSFPHYTHARTHMEKTGRESASEEEGGAAPPPHSVTPSRVLLSVVPSTHAEKEERNRGGWRRICCELAAKESRRAVVIVVLIMTCHRHWSQPPSSPFILVVAVAAGLPWSRCRVEREEEEFSSLLCTQSSLLLPIPPLMLPPLSQPPLSCCAAVDLLNYHPSYCWLVVSVCWVQDCCCCSCFPQPLLVISVSCRSLSRHQSCCLVDAAAGAPLKLVIVAEASLVATAAARVDVALALL
ncbi:uncharacterized protein LOC107641940 [Arachis ipaensis]|uniref:uncharacterized protein LOC107641940 n=1 Tax=Arachis ipaensis TaxID=130454 RepID=UPI000A2B834B|nr:uncharacterized protein LOC107641940 [Arachis ipaensis]